MRLQRLAASIEAVHSTDVFLSCVVLFSLAVAQPILDLLGRNSEFFVARSSPPSDVLLVGFALATLAPILLGLIVLLMRRLHIVIGALAHGLTLIFLVTLLMIDLIERTSWVLRTRWLLAVGLICGIGLLALFYRSAGFRFVLRVASFSPIAVLAGFVFLSGATNLIFRGETVIGPTGITVGNPVPIVMVVFDEFPVASIIDGEGNLQSEDYPGFARLATDGTWFRNAVTNESNTERALPALLTGTPAIGGGTLPTAHDYPSNLFTLLAGIYEIDAIEALTDLCPESVCLEESTQSRPERWARIIDDLSIVSRHILLPEGLTRDLPPIDQSWSNFRVQLAPAADTDTAEEFDLRARFDSQIDEGRPKQLEAFFDHLGPSGSAPSFDFAHFILPHAPWEYLPDGRRHGAPQPPHGKVNTGWGSDTWLVNQAYQRHLLQLQYADALIGELIDRLEAAGSYDETLVIVLADHGIVMKPNIERRRAMNAGTIGDIAAVPLFIKIPDGPVSLIDDYRAELIDVLPTIADILDISVPWFVQGTSLATSDRPIRLESVINSGLVTYGVAGEEKYVIAQHKIDVFGTDGLFMLAPSGTRDLLGQSVHDLDIQPDTNLSGRIINAAAYENVDVESDFLPAYVHGSISIDIEAEPVLTAVSLNGVISAITRSYVRDDEVLFQAVLPPDAFRTGPNDVQLVLVDDSPNGRVLSAISDT